MINKTLLLHAAALKTAGHHGAIYMLRGRFAPKSFNNGFNKWLRAKFLCEVKFHSLWFCTHLGIVLTVRGDKRIPDALEEYLALQVRTERIGSAIEVFKGMGSVTYMSTLTLLQSDYFPQPKQRSFGGSRLPSVSLNE
ncbi:hypothetical protein HTV13_07410 [Pseudomonas putida]|jgi:hypothetical protein|uniref:hypothetical protein n=1 Tax=Pseudomonas putida TaxID=303 RepID=UPI0015739DCD|nr:hypothetical protein [Pseudomonas putida]NSX19657.1 hypothetical protein [Pseudomonas putida]